MSAIVIYYSRADENYFCGEYRYIEIGNTEKAAKIIAEATGAETFKLEQKIPYAKEYDTCIAQAKKDLQSNSRPELISYPSIEDYDEIYLGYPNYWGTMPMAVYTFLEKFDFTGKTIHPFCTHEGSGLGRTENDIRKAAKGAEVAAGLAIFGSSVDSAGENIKEWI